jgi:steroid delta-isomerase-like uncharacterized protein
MQTDSPLALLERHCAAWNAHDIDALMALVTDDCVFDAAAGPGPHGARHAGRAAVREAFVAVWQTFPDAQWCDARHSVVGGRGFSEWTFRGTRRDGVCVEVRGLDVLELRDGRISRKDTFRKTVSA